jgi:hypothetical protein
MNQRKRFNANGYAGLVFQWIVGLGCFLFAGIKIDAYFKWHTPMLTWIMPLLFITAMIIKMILETGKNSKK